MENLTVNCSVWAARLHNDTGAMCCHVTDAQSIARDIHALLHKDNMAEALVWGSVITTCFFCWLRMLLNVLMMLLFFFSVLYEGSDSRSEFDLGDVIFCSSD